MIHDPEKMVAELERILRRLRMVYDKASMTDEEFESLASLDVICLSEAIETMKHLIPTPPISKKGR